MGEGDGGGGRDGVVYTHTFADTPDGMFEHEPIKNSETPHPGITRKGLKQLQWEDTLLEWTANESEPPQPEFELLSAPLQ